MTALEIVGLSLSFLLGLAGGALLVLWRENALLRRLQFGDRTPIQQQRPLVDEESQVANAIAPPRELVSEEQIARGARELLEMARVEGKELSHEEARRQAMVMLMQEQGLLE